MFEVLRSDDSDSEEMNAHLQERFSTHGGSSSRREMAMQADRSSPVTTAIRGNSDIRKYFAVAKEAPVEGAEWLSKPEIPSSEEMLREIPRLGPPIDNSQLFLTTNSSFTPSPQPDENCSSMGERETDSDRPQPNKIDGPYSSNEEYLRTQYNLLREDVIRPLRETIAMVRADPLKNEKDYQGGTVGLYEPVHFTSIIFSPRGIAVRAAFSLGRVQKHVRWDQSKRLITGTLVALTPANDAFKSTCVLATIAARPLAALDQNPPEIDLFIQAQDIDIDPKKKWIMVENRTSFFEAGRHTLMALQHQMREPQPFPLAKHLINVEKDVDNPRWIHENPHLDLSPIVSIEEGAQFENVNVLDEWMSPTSSPAGLDRSQNEALHRILTKSLAIVQGPPGTGKTYVSVQALKVLVANMQDGDPPIVVTCQTNHALDQLLRHVAPVEPKFVRLGGRSKDQGVVKSRTMFEMRSSISKPNKSGSLKSWAWGEMRRLTTELRTLLSPLEANQPPLDHKLLRKLGVITPEQADSIQVTTVQTLGIPIDTPGIHMELWLGKMKTPSTRPIEPDFFGFQFEAEDVEIEQLEELEAEAVAKDDDDIEALKGPVTLLSDNWAGKMVVIRTDEQIEEILRNTQNLQSIRPNIRGVIYNYFLKRVKKIITDEFRVKAKKYEELVQARKAGMWEQDFDILKQQRIIGMTTTGLSKYRALVSSLKPKIVLVEEAAETLEAPVTVACVPTLQQLVLVGDHKQLRPQCQVSAHENEPYFFNISLFERMVQNGVEFSTLTRQRRMIPEIRRLLRPIYKDLKDHPVVKQSENRPPVEGMGNIASFFWTHNGTESQDSNMSFQNANEAAMVVGHYAYLVLNGVDPSKITVLTFYNGQRKLIHRRLRENPDLSNHHAAIKVVTVDSYQGEENDIVLLSLVRSNRKCKIGFLSVNNRVCVALSRARRGFYIFGNGELMACESGIWAALITIMWGKSGKAPESGPKQRIGFHLPITCANHNNKSYIEAPADWSLVNGGCTDKCTCVLLCGHPCTLRCHPFDSSRINCMQKCPKKVDTCGHICSGLCCDTCYCAKCQSKEPSRRPLVKPAPQGMLLGPNPMQPLSLPVQQKKLMLELPSSSAVGTGVGNMDTSLLEDGASLHDSGKKTASGPLIDLTTQPIPSESNGGDLLIDLGPAVPAAPRRFRFTDMLVVHENGRVDVSKQETRYDLLD